MEEILLRTIYVNATFFTMDQENQIFEKGMMIVENQSISYIGPYSIKRLADTDLVVDLGGKWVLPGLVNVHSHIVMTLLRGIGDDMLLKPWLETKIWPIEAQFTTEIASVSAQGWNFGDVKIGNNNILRYVQSKRYRTGYCNASDWRNRYSWGFFLYDF